MRSLVMVTTAFVVACASIVALAQQVNTPDQLDAAMKRVAAGFGGANKAIMSMSYADARTQLAATKAAIVDAENLWVVNKKTDAVMFSKNVQAAIDATDKLLAAPAVDQMAAAASMKQLQAACGSCHMVYRVRDEAMNWVTKPGTF